LSDFLTHFRSFFSDEERESELYKILATIGVNTEKTILEELNAEVRRSSEASMFSENKLRSWLAFFLTPVRNAVSATGFGRVVLNSMKDSKDNLATVSKGAILIGRNGKEYQIQNDLTLDLGCSTPFSFVQGTEVVLDQPYSEFIAIPLGSSMVDLSYTKVSYSGVSGSGVIPQVATFPSYPKDLEEVFPDVNAAVHNFAGGVVGYTSLWNPLLKSMKSLWDAVVGVSVRPRSGFFPFIFNNTLYIKIFPGGNSGDVDYVPFPEGQTVHISYLISDGAAGNLSQNELMSFSGDSSPKTEDNVDVDVTLYNDEAISGVNPPIQSELVNKLRQHFFASTHISSIPEYSAWFLSQAGIGDCLVVSDFERWRLSNRKDFTGFDLTGAMSVYLVHDNGTIVIPRTPAGYIPFITNINNRLVSLMDAAFLEYKEPRVFWHYFVVQFRAVSSEVAFIEHVKAALRDLYSILWVRQSGSSLFRDLDMNLITDAVKGNFDVSGLRITPYHYYEYVSSRFVGVISEGSEGEGSEGEGSEGEGSEGEGSKFMVSIPIYYGEKPGGWYEYWEVNSEGELGHYERVNGLLDFKNGVIDEANFIPGSPYGIYKEFIELGGNACKIYRYEARLLSEGDPSAGWDWSSLYLDPNPFEAGVRKNDSVTFNIWNLAPGVLRCFWGIANEGLVPVGNNLSSDFGIRKLPNIIEVSQGGSLYVGAIPSTGHLPSGTTYFGDSVRFEKYS